jgi:SH3 domain-containing protein
MEGKEKPTHVITEDTPYYTNPAQAQPPDGTFAAGTKVTLLQDAGSYTQVRAEDGTTGYVATGSLKPL